MSQLVFAIKDNGTTVALHQMDSFYSDKARYVKVFKENSEVHVFDRVHDNNLFLPTNLERTRVELHDEENNKLDESIVDLKKYVRKAPPKKGDLQYEKMKRKVKHEMNFPQGTEAEKQEHTRLLRNATSDEKAKAYVKSRMTNILVTHFNVKPNKIEPLVHRLFGDLYGLGILQELDEHPDVGEIMVNAREFPDFWCVIKYTMNGKEYWYDKTFDDIYELRQAFDNTIRFDGKELNKLENPRVEATRPNRDRVTIVIPEASDNWTMNIRKFTNFVPNEKSMRKSGTINDDIHELLRLLVHGHANIGIGGAMDTGKTTTINYLLSYTPPIERKVVIASVSETDVDRVLAGHDVVVFNVNEKRGLTFEELLRTSLRTTASRVIIPESRGGEFKELYEANLKTRGNMFTAHALDDESFLDMTVDMYLSSDNVNANESSELIKNKITKAVDVVMIMRKVGSKKRIKSISEVLQDEKGNYAGMNPLIEYTFDPENPEVGQYERTGNRISDRLRKSLNEHGVKYSEMNNI